MKTKSQNSLNAIFLLSILGWLNAAYTLWHRQKIVGGVAQGKSFCNFSSTFNCDAVALSRHSLFLNIPVSSWGLIFYSVLFVLCIWALFSRMDQKEEDTKKASHLIFILSAVSLVPTLYLTGVSYLWLKTICIMCTMTYILNIALFIASYLNFKTIAKPKVAESLKGIPQIYIIFMIGLFLLQLISGKIVNNLVSATDENIDSKTIEMFVARHFSSKTENFNLENAPFYGPANAPITLVEFSDFQCPFCARSAITMPSLIADYKDKVRIVFKNYPLDPSCNAEMKGGGHPHACVAAKTGWCVFKLKGNESFFRYKSIAFENQEGVTPSKYMEWALAEGLDKATLETCLNDFETSKIITEQIAEAKAAGVQGTPAIFVNGKSLEAGFVPRIFKAVLDKY